MRRGRGGEGEVVDVNMAHVLMLLSRGAVGVAEAHRTPERVFVCKTCNRQFPSFQALGGHRASHKKPKLVDEQAVGKASPGKPRVHECSICGLEFALGQALGGHMRRHRVPTPNRPQISTTHATAHHSGSAVEDAGGGKGGGGSAQLQAPCLDLNLTPMENDAELRLLTFSLGLPMVH